MAYTKDLDKLKKEILSKVPIKWKELNDLRIRFEDDLGLWRLEPYTLGKDGEYENYTSNEPKTLADKVIEILSTSPIILRIPLETEDEEERRLISNAERFVYGARALANSRLQIKVQPSIQEQKAFYATLRGWFAERVYIHKDKNNKTIPDIAVWDIFRTSWEAGEDGLLWACHTRPVTKAQAKAQYDYKMESEKGTVFDYWDEEIYCVIIADAEISVPNPDGKLVIDPIEHGLGHTPVLITKVGSAPFIQSDKFADTIKNTGDSIFSRTRNQYDPNNKIMTYYMTVVQKGVHNPLVEYVAGGKSKMQKSPYYPNALVTLDSEKDERLEPMFKPTMPQDALALQGMISQKISMGGLSPLVYGQTPFPESGYEANLLMQATASSIKPIQKTIEASEEWEARELLTQFAKGGFGTLKLHGRDGSNEYFDVKFTAKDVKGDWFPEATMMPILPENTMQKYTIAGIAVEKKLLSKQTARDKLLGVQDTDLEGEKINREEAEELPSVKIRRIMDALVKDGRPDLAQQILQEFQAGLQVGETKQPPQPDAKRPEFATGVPREAMPGEEIGQTPMPPDVAGEISGAGI